MPPAATNVAECMRAFYAAGVRLLSCLDLLGPYGLRQAQIERVAAEVLPLLTDLTGDRQPGQPAVPMKPIFP